MNANYINRHLIKLCELLYGKDSPCFSRKEVFNKQEFYVFGVKHKKKKKCITNTVSKQFALYIVADTNSIKFGLMKKTKYQITFLNLETGQRNVYSGGAAFDLEEAKVEIKLMKKQQKELANVHDLPRTRSDFKKKKVFIYT